MTPDKVLRPLFARAWMFTALVLAIGALCLTSPNSHGQPSKDEGKEKEKSNQPAVKLGLNLNNAKQTCQGYTLLAPANSTTTYLIDMEGRVVRTWHSDCKPGHSVYLL